MAIKEMCKISMMTLLTLCQPVLLCNNDTGATGVDQPLLGHLSKPQKLESSFVVSSRNSSTNISSYKAGLIMLILLWHILLLALLSVASFPSACLTSAREMDGVMILDTATPGVGFSFDPDYG